MLHGGRLRRLPVTVDHPVDDGLPQSSRRDHPNLAVDEALSHMNGRVGHFRRLFGLVDLPEERTLTPNPLPAIPARHLSPQVVDAEIRRGHEQQTACVVKSAGTVCQVQASHQVGHQRSGQFQIGWPSPLSQVTAGKFDSNRAYVRQSMSGGLPGPVETASMQSSGVPG